MDSGRKVYIDEKEGKIRFKRKPVTEIPPLKEKIHLTTKCSYPNNENTQILERFLKRIEGIGRLSDFWSVVTVVGNGILKPTNIVLHLLLDIGQLLRQEPTQHALPYL